MGRPLNKRLFGVEGVGPTAAGNEIKVNFNSGAGVKEGYIVKQKGSKRFLVEEIGTGGTHTCSLVWDDVPANLAAGEMSISVQGNDNETYNVSKITGRKVTVVAPNATGSNALDGLSLAWDFAAASAGKVKLEEAGDDDVANTDDDDFNENA